MEKIALMVVAVMMATVSVNAQDDDLQNEIGVFYGFGSASNVVSTFTEAFSGAVGDQSSFWGPVGIEYFHHVTPVVSVGAMASFAGCNVSSKEGNSSFTERFITVMPAVKFNWLRKESFGMYSGLAVGAMFYSGDTKGDPTIKGESKVTVMFHATAIGAEVGGQLRGFAELGFGEKGLLCAGLRYKF